MVKVKDLATIQANYSGSVGTASTRYGAAAPNITWQAPAQAGQALYTQRMQDPTVLARRNTGISKVSDAAFRTAVQNKGVPIIAGRMTAAAPKMAANFAPYKSALEALTLPAKSSDAMQNIDQRLKPVVAAMVATKNAQG